MFGLEDLFDFNRNGEMYTLEFAAMHTSLYDLTNDTLTRRKTLSYGNGLSNERNSNYDDNDRYEDY